MNEDLRNDELLMSYLLGKLPEEAAERLEERLIEDDELFELCEAVEADLLAAYDRGDLTGVEKEQVHRLAFSPGGRERLALARALNRESDRIAASVVPFRRRVFPMPHFGNRWAALAAAVLLAVTGALWIAQQISEDGLPLTGHDISSTTTGTETDAQEQSGASEETPVAEGPAEQPLPIEPQPEPTPEPAPTPLVRPKLYVLTLALADIMRGADDAEGAPKHSIPPDVEFVKIQLDLKELGLDEVESFQAAVRNQGGEIVYEGDNLKPHQVADLGGVLILKIPAQRLPDGRYEVAVTAGTEVLAPKEFEVVREHE